MTNLVVRRLLIDLAEPIAARWNGGDAFRSAFFNALSMSFPVGEQYFMDSVRAGLKALPEDPKTNTLFAAQAAKTSVVPPRMFGILHAYEKFHKKKWL